MPVSSPEQTLEPLDVAGGCGRRAGRPVQSPSAPGDAHERAGRASQQPACGLAGEVRHPLLLLWLCVLYHEMFIITITITITITI